ncbi:MAG: hypothetical protein JNM07_01515 [Phycisphaerae bacterium]|nr:hypothetical protein [Phycisphaerae bacterium]
MPGSGRGGRGDVKGSRCGGESGDGGRGGSGSPDAGGVGAGRAAGAGLRRGKGAEVAAEDALGNSTDADGIGLGVELREQGIEGRGARERRVDGGERAKD